MLAVFGGIAGHTLTLFALVENRRDDVLMVFAALLRWGEAAP